MKIQIDLKSALIGLAVGVLAMFALGAESSSNLIGKYQATTGAGFGLIIDTTSGKVWFANVSAANMVQVDKGFFEPKEGR